MGIGYPLGVSYSYTRVLERCRGLILDLSATVT